MILIAFLQSTEDGDSTHLIRLINHDGLESAFQSLILLEVFLILVKGRCTDGTQFTTGKGWLQDIGSIHSPLTTTSTHKGVNLIDEEDDTTIGTCNLRDNTLQSFLELALILRTCHKSTHIERIEHLILQVLRHVTTHDTLCQPLDDGSLTSTRLTY